MTVENFPVEYNLTDKEYQGYQGDTWEGIVFTVIDDAYDWSTATPKSQARDSSDNLALEFDVDVTVSTTNTANDTVAVKISATSTKMEGLRAGTYYYDVQLRFPDAALTTVTIADGQWVTRKDRTKNA